MSQSDFLAGFDADARAAFLDAGLADMAVYTAPGGAAIPCTVLIDRNVQLLGDFAEASNNVTTLTLFHDDVPAPVVGAIVVVDGSGETLRLESVTVRDESREVWIARRG